MVVKDDEKPYGVRLKAQPDSDRLGKRLKGEFKKVSAAIAGEWKIVSVCTQYGVYKLKLIIRQLYCKHNELNRLYVWW